MEHILLISYTFPPYPGIGGRRWAKFAKYLAKSGYVIHVVHAPNPFLEKSLWISDIDNNNIHRYEVKSYYPKSLITNPTSFLQKISSRLSILSMNFLTKGTPYDRGVFWKKLMLKKSTYLIEKFSIKNVIVSCAPFSSAYFSLELKEKFSDINLMIDFRDPWTWGKGYGFSSLDKHKLLFEKKNERDVIENSDLIFVPSSEMETHLKSVYPKFVEKVKLLPHGFDTDEVYRKQKKESNVVRLLFFGNLYANLEKVVNELRGCLLEFNDKVSLDIYSPSQNYRELFESSFLIGNNVNYYSPLPPKELFNKMDSYDFVLILQPDYAKDFITTKIYEIIYSGTPIILVSNEGKLSDFIIKNKLGYFFTQQNLAENFKLLFEATSTSFKLETFPIQNYSYSNITSNLISYFK